MVEEPPKEAAKLKSIRIRDDRPTIHTPCSAYEASGTRATRSELAHLLIMPPQSSLSTRTTWCIAPSRPA